MELLESQLQLGSPHENFISGVAHPEIVYMLVHFQILCIDRFFKKKKKALTLILMELTRVGSNHLKVFLKMDALSS